MSALTNFTGPNTPEGKENAQRAEAPFCAQKNVQRAEAPFCAQKVGSSMNALKHGFSSKKFIVMPGQQDDFNKLQSGLIAEVRPEGALETTLFQQLLRAAWTLHRVELRQAEMAESGRDPLFDPACEKEFDRIERYHARAQSGFHRSMRQLRSIQTNRILQTVIPEPLGRGALPSLVKATEIIALAKRTHKSWNALAMNTLIEATKLSREAFSTENTKKEPAL